MDLDAYQKAIVKFDLNKWNIYFVKIGENMFFIFIYIEY